MVPVLPEDLLADILDSLDVQYTANAGSINNIWNPGRISTLRSCALTSHLFYKYARPRLFAHIDFDAGRDAQGRAARLLQLLQTNDDDNPRGSRGAGLRSVRLRDGRRSSTSSKITLGMHHSETGPRTPIQSLMELWLEAPDLRVFAFEGDVWTLAGGSELAGYREYIRLIGAKPSLCVLALSNVHNLPIAVVFPSDGLPRTRLRSIDLSNTSFVISDKVKTPGDVDLVAPGDALDIEHLKLGRLNYVHFLNMFTTRQPPSNAMQTAHARSGHVLAAWFRRLSSLSVALSPVPQQLLALWDLVYGVRDSLEHLHFRSYHNTTDSTDTIQTRRAIDIMMSEHTLDQLLRVRTLTLSTHILGSPKRWTDSTGRLNSGISYLADLLARTVDPIPQLETIVLEIFFMGEEIAIQEPVSLEKTSTDPVWRVLDRALALACGHSVAVSIILRPFFFVKQDGLSDIERKYARIKAGFTADNADNANMDRCLPDLFHSGREVDVRVESIFSDKDLLTYLRTA